MKRLTDMTIAVNIGGLAILAALESWRPGSVSAGVNSGYVWLVSTALLLLVIKHSRTK